MINIRSFRISYKLEVLNAFTFLIYKSAKVHNVRLTALFKNTQTLKFRSRLYGPFPSSKKSHFQNEAKCETFVVKMIFICIIIKNHFHINGLALSLALKVRFFGTRKWPKAFFTAVHSRPQSPSILGHVVVTIKPVAKGWQWLPSIIITITWLEIQKDTKRIEIHQSQTMTFWTLWSKRLFPKRSAKIIDGSKGRKRILAFKIKIRVRGVFEKSSNHSCLYFMFYYKARMAQQEKQLWQRCLIYDLTGNNAIERISTYKILGVFIDSDLKWNSHVDYIYTAISRRVVGKSDRDNPER